MSVAVGADATVNVFFTEPDSLSSFCGQRFNMFTKARHTSTCAVTVASDAVLWEVQFLCLRFR